MKILCVLKHKISFKKIHFNIFFKISALIYLTFIMMINVITPTTAYFSDENIYINTLPTVDISKEEEESEDLLKEEEMIETETSNEVSEDKLNKKNENEDQEHSEEVSNTEDNIKQ